jgi:hypothetical protein
LAAGVTAQVYIFASFKSIILMATITQAPDGEVWCLKDYYFEILLEFLICKAKLTPVTVFKQCEQVSQGIDSLTYWLSNAVGEACSECK